MDFPRDPRGLRRASFKRWLRRLALLLFMGIVPLILFVAFRDRNTPVESFTYSPPPPLPDSTWMAEIFEWAEGAAPLNSLIISFEDSVIAEHYFRGMRTDRQVNVKSVSKTLLSAMIGIALEAGYFENLDQRVEEFLPAYFEGITDSRKREITLENLITMRSGLRGTSFDNYNPWILSRNWIRYVLEQPITAVPGSRYQYSTGNTHLLSAILTESTGMSTLAFGRRYLFEPLDIRLRAWDRDPQGYYLGGNNMHLTPREMLAFGQLYLHRGRLGNRQIISEQWVEDSWRPKMRSFSSYSGYGYGWWYRRTSGFDVYYAVGYGGQYIFVVPDLDLTVVATSSLANRSRGRRPSVYSLLRSQIIPAIRDRIRNRLALEIPLFGYPW